MGRRDKRRKRGRARGKTMGKNKGWKDPIGSYDDLVWDKAMGAYVPRHKLIADPPRSRYNDPMNGDFDTRETEGGRADDDEASWDGYGRARDAEVRGGDSMEDFAVVNKAASRSYVKESLANNRCPKCQNRYLTREIAENGDVMAKCGECGTECVDEDFGKERPSTTRPSLSDLAAGRYPDRGSQGRLFERDRWDDHRGGYGSGAGYGGYQGRYGGYSSYSGGGGIGFIQPRQVRTSKTHPLQVDFVDAKAHGRSGRLGMTFAPGKKHYGMSADHERDLDEDLKTLCQKGANTLVCLIEDHEFDTLKVPDLLEKAQAAGIETLWHPIKDFGVPHDTEAFLDLLNVILDELEAGKTVVVHCKGGLGRTGTVVASTLVALGWEPKAAIEHTRKARKGTVENLTQENYVSWIDSCFE